MRLQKYNIMDCVNKYIGLMSTKDIPYIKKRVEERYPQPDW